MKNLFIENYIGRIMKNFSHVEYDTIDTLNYKFGWWLIHHSDFDVPLVTAEIEPWFNYEEYGKYALEYDYSITESGEVVPK